MESLPQFGARSPINKIHRNSSNPILQKSRRDQIQNQSEEDPQEEAVDLSCMSLHHLPSLSTNLQAISKLDLSNNNLQIIPESLIARTVNVVELDVHSNQLTALPNSIGCLSKLKILNVSSNLLHSLPRTIENCRSLEEINANFNNLTSLPETIGFELINLKKLSVNSNKIVFLPYSTSHLTALRVLDVCLNSLKALPDDLESLTNLQLLNVGQNFHHLSELPDSIGLLQSLLELDASYNHITALPPSIACLQKLQKLSLQGNPLVSPPMQVVELGLHRVRTYLTDKMNGGAPQPKHNKSSSWFGRFKKHANNNNDGRTGTGRHKFPRKNPIEAIASPRYFTMLSPNRWFSSPQHSFSRLS